MNETRLYLASQGYLENVDEGQRILTVIIVLLVLAILFAGHLFLKKGKKRKQDAAHQKRERKH
ncbi:MAG: hypothetical protein HQL76_08640 [Magnetococcales bacterium]|nr:hypothetical protein [Magnetococcales bacterium]